MGQRIYIIFGAIIVLIFVGLFVFPEKSFAADTDLVINEIFPAPTSGDEFVELYNTSSQEIILSSGWQLDDIADGGSRPYNIEDGTRIEPHGYLVFYKKIALNNSGDTVRLLKNNIEISKISYSDAPKDMSYVRDTSGTWFWTDQRTPGVDNPSRPIYSREVYINEILPYPANGSDNEFIELYNSSENIVDLSNWTLDDVVGSGASAYKIEQGVTIPGRGYIVFYKKDTKITLNDDGDEVNLLDPAGERVSSIPYSKTKKSESFMRTDDGFWRWTIIATPLSENILRLPSTANFGSDFEDFRVISIKTGETSNYEGRKVEIIGEVTETSGDTFYLDDGTGVIKCYIQAKTNIDKPRMQKGYQVRVRGRVDLYRGVWRILPEQQEDVEIIDENKNQPVSGSKAKNNIANNAEIRDSQFPIARALAATDASNLLKDAASNDLNQKSNVSIFNKIVISIIITATLLLLLLVGEYLWKKKLRPAEPKKQKNLPNNSPPT